jgi:hypothetical protein
MAQVVADDRGEGKPVAVHYSRSDMAGSEKIVAVVGAGRDGSTLLQRLLDGSPGLWMYPVEIKFANRFDAAVEAVWPPAVPAADRLLRRAGLRPTVRTAAPDAKAPGHLLQAYAEEQFRAIDDAYLPKLREPLQRRPSEPVYDAARGYRLTDALQRFLEAAWSAYGPADEPPLLAFKTIEIEHEARYARALPETRFVHIVRDPLTQFASTKRTVLQRPGFLFHYPVGDVVTTFVKRYAKHARATVEALEQAPGRHLLVRYEQVLEAPAAVVERICSWLQIPPPPEPDVQTLFGGRHSAEFPSNPSQAGVQTPEQVVKGMAEKHGYDSVTTPREERFVLACCAGWASRLGYDYPDDRLSLGERGALLRDWARIEDWERDVLRRQTGLRSLIRRRVAVLETVLGHPPG